MYRANFNKVDTSVYKDFLFAYNRDLLEICHELILIIVKMVERMKK